MCLKKYNNDIIKKFYSLEKTISCSEEGPSWTKLKIKNLIKKRIVMTRITFKENDKLFTTFQINKKQIRKSKYIDPFVPNAPFL